MLKRAVSCSLATLLSYTAVCAADDAHFAILPASEGRAAIDQCSRNAPEHVTGFWQPTPTQVKAVERALPAFLHAHSHDDWLRGSFRQYVGLVVARKRLIYLNA